MKIIDPQTCIQQSIDSVTGNGSNSLQTLMETGVVDQTNSEVRPTILKKPQTWSGVFDIYVEPSLTSAIASSLDVYANDLRLEGYKVTIQEFSGSAQQLRTQLQRRKQHANLEGALFVGDLPFVQFTSEDNWRTNPIQTTYPHDLYFMDLDGEYIFNQQGLDSHTGDVGPEIYISRLTASNLGSLTDKTEAELINDYLEKVHRVRTGEISYEDRGIIFADDDWQNSFRGVLSPLYSDVNEIRNPNQTTRETYIDVLNQNAETLLETIHSWPQGHAIGGVGGGTVTSSDIVDINPKIGFLNMFNCSSANFTQPNNLIGTYLFTSDRIVNAIGSTKTGSMLNFQQFYTPQGNGDSMGQAFLQWFDSNAVATDNPAQDWKLDWFYGMTMQGDPTLRPESIKPQKENIINGTPDDDLLIGTPNKDRINGFDGNDNIIALAGDDFIEGGFGDDTILGQEGDDSIFPNFGNDIIFAGPGDDFIQDTGEAQGTGKNQDQIFAGDGNDVVFAGGGNDFVSGGPGDDFLRDDPKGNGGDDFITGGPGNDSVIGDDGNDTLNGGSGNDTLTGGADQDKFAIAAGEDTNTITDFTGVGTGVNPSREIIHEVDTLQFFGSKFTAKNMLLTQSGNDLKINFQGVKDTTVILENFALENLDNLTTQTGASTTVGNILFDGQRHIQDSFDVFNADQLSSTVFNRNTVTFLNDLNNTTQGFDHSNDVINGQKGSDILLGRSGDDLLRGNEDDDILLDGGAGNDLLDGGAGNDGLFGGTGNDQFVLRAGDGTDTIFDFEDGIDSFLLADNLQFEQLGINSSNGNTLITFTDTNEVLASLVGVDSNNIGSEDFLTLS